MKSRAWAAAAVMAVAASLLSAAPAYADTATALCTNTTYVNGSTSKTKGTNYGSSPDLVLNGAVKTAFVECTVPAGTIPAGATGVTAALKVFSRSTATAHTVRLHNEPTAWTEGTVTWNSLHTYDAAVLSSASGDTVPGSGEWVSLAVPNVTGNGTWRFALETATASDQAYASDDYTTDTTRRPYLQIDYTLAPVVVAPVASFTASPTTGTEPLTVQFTDTSTNGPTSWAWDFGDGTGSTLQNEQHTYTAAGTYTATLTATNAAGSSTASTAITVSAAPPADPIPAEGAGWARVYSSTFDVDNDPLAEWSRYNADTTYPYGGAYGSDPYNCPRTDHMFAQAGNLVLLMKYRTDLPACGGVKNGVQSYPSTRWYTGGGMLSSAYASINQQVTMRYRIVYDDPKVAVNPADTTSVRSHDNLPMHIGEASCWPNGGEIDYMEGTNPTTRSTFSHWGTNCSDLGPAVGPNYAADFRSTWHTVRVQRNNHTITVWIDDLVTPKYTRTGDATSYPDALQRLVLQQECRSAGCPATDATTTQYTVEDQIDWISVANPT